MATKKYSNTTIWELRLCTGSGETGNTRPDKMDNPLIYAHMIIEFNEDWSILSRKEN